MADFVITVYHDLRRAKGGDKYPVKIRAYHSGKTRYYPTGTDLSEEDFKRSYLAERPRGEYSDIKDKLNAELNRAKEIARELRPFTLDRFEKKFIRKTGSGHDVFFHYAEKIKALEAEDRIKTASGYHLSQKAIKDFLKYKGRVQSSLSFDQITVKWLEQFAGWMQDQGKTFTTIGIYIRNLRTIFNQAIEAEDITAETYPFGESKYMIPEGEGTKRALTQDEVIRLYHYELDSDDPMKKARDFWFFSYLANGMNMRDICELKRSDLGKDRFRFIRTKTKNTVKKKKKPIEVILSDPLKEIIEKYGTRSKNPQQYVFPVFSHTMTAKEKVRACEAFTRFINTNIKKLAKLADVDPEISTYFARHSFTSISVNNGASLEFIQESLGHQNLKTTQGYFAGFTEAKKIENTNRLLKGLEK